MKININILLLLATISTLIIPVKSFAQSDYEKQTATFSIDLAKKIIKSNKLKVAVSDFLDNDGNLTELGKAIAEDIGVGIVNEGEGNFQVMERSNLNAILKEQKLASTGLIDPETAKQLGKLKMVDAVIVGNITPFGNSFRVTIKILDTETGMSIAAAVGNLAGTDDIKGLFNKKITIFNPTSQTIKADTSTINGNAPSKDIQGCETKNTGDYCFYNGYKKQVTLSIYYYTVYETGGDPRVVQTDVIVKPGESKCIYNVYLSYSGNFTAVEIDDPNTKEYENPKTIDKGDFIAEKCKSIKYIIK